MAQEVKAQVGDVCHSPVERWRDRGDRRGHQERERAVNGAVAGRLLPLLEGAACALREGSGGAPPSRPSAARFIQKMTEWVS